MDSTTSFRVARIGGIPIRIHITFLLVLPFLAYSFGHTFVDAARLAGVPAGQIVGSPWLWGLGIALALFGSVLVHELAHSLYAVRRGGKVRSITLLMIGGVSELAAPPKGEAAMALAGPATSAALGGAFLALSRITAAAGLPSSSFALFYLGQLNLVLCAFNLLPAFPMDGGRILRGALARRMGPVRATGIAARFGRAFAVLFAVLGFLSLNILLLFISFVVYVGAETELRQVVVQAALGDLRVRDFMTPLEGGVGANEPLPDVAARMNRERRTAYPVLDDGRVVGFITANALKRIDIGARDRVLARDVVRPAATVETQARLADALHLLAEAGPEIAVVDADRIVGTLSRLDVARGLDLLDLAHAPGAGATARPSPGPP